MSVIHRSRIALQKYLPDFALGLGGLAKVIYKTKIFKESKILRESVRRKLLDKNGKALEFEEFEHRVLSQNGEDGVLEAIFQVIGFNSRKTLEFGFAATEASFINIAISYDLQGYFMDGSDDTIRLAKSLFKFVGKNRLSAKQHFITVENINSVISQFGLQGEIDALSIDVDGNDYWLWKNLDIINPRLVVAEYNDRLGPEASITIAYDPKFNCALSQHEFYQGASLTALTKLADSRGYRLIGCESSGTNAFFLRTDVVAPLFPTKTVGDAFHYHSRTKLSARTEIARNKLIESLPFVHV